MAAPIFTLYTRPGCHLCETMHDTVAPVAAELGASVDLVDISSDPDLEARYGLEIPVLFVNGRKAAKYRISTGDLRRHLQSHG
jgi:glutaredoxin